MKRKTKKLIRGRAVGSSAIVLPLPKRLWTVGVGALAKAKGESVNVTWEELSPWQKAGWRAVARYVRSQNEKRSDASEAFAAAPGSSVRTKN